MACNTTGLCVICNCQVTEDDHRREIDCPSKSCPGRVYHEDCIATYLRRTKYSKDRCTGFPCPAILSTGKQCPGYVCKMHAYFPSNQKKKQARLEAAIAAAAAPRPRPISVKPKAGAQAAMAAMKRAGPEGIGCFVQAPKGPQFAGCAIADGRPGAIMTSDVQEQRFIPGLDPELTSTGLRARGAKHKAQAVVSRLKQSPNNVSGDVNSDSGGREWAPHATVLDAFATAPGESGDLHFHLERHNRQYSGQCNGGQFSAFMYERLNGAPNASLEAVDAKSPPEWGYTTPRRGAEGSRLDRANDSSKKDSSLALSVSPATEASSDWGAIGGVDGGTQRDTARTVMDADQDNDPVIEYAIVYHADDGSYLVLDAVTNAYFRLADLYGESPELDEVPGEDGNMYTCVVVRKSIVEARAQRQQAWFDAQEQLQLKQEQEQAWPQVLAAHAEEATAGAEMFFAEAYGASSPSGNTAGVPPMMFEQPEEAEEDVASLMALLGM